MDWLTAVDPPKWGWTALGGIQDILPPHERARRVKKSLPMTKEAAVGEEVVVATTTTTTADGQSKENHQALLDGYHDNLLAGQEPRSSTNNQLLPNKVLTTVMDTNHYFNPNTVARVTVRFPLGTNEKEEDMNATSTAQNTEQQPPPPPVVAAAAVVDQPAAEESVHSRNPDQHTTTLHRTASSLSRRSSTLSAASSISLHGRNRTTTVTNTTAAATTGGMEVDWFEETLDWDLGDPETLSPELFSYQVAQKFGLSWHMMMDLQFSIEQQLHYFIQHKINYRPPITVTDPSGLCNRLDDENYSITQVVQLKSTPGITMPQSSSRSGYSSTNSSHIRSRPRFYPSNSFLSHMSESTHTTNTRHHGGGGKAANSRRSRGSSSSANGLKASASATTNTTVQSHSPSFTKLVLDRLKQQSLEQPPETDLVSPKATVNAVCHICHARKSSCLLFACGISQHSYCSNHVLSRLETSIADVCRNADNTLMYQSGFCPVCTVHCACAKCGRRLQRLLDYVASLCVASASSSSEDVTTSTDNNTSNNIDAILTQLLPTLDLFPLAKGTKPIPENVEVLDSSDIVANIKRRRCDGTTTTSTTSATTTAETNNENDSNSKNPEDPSPIVITSEKREPKQLRPTMKATTDDRQLSEEKASFPRLRNVRTNKKYSFATSSSSSNSSCFSEKEVVERKKRVSVRKLSEYNTIVKADPFDFPYELHNGEEIHLPPGVERNHVKIFNVNVEETNEPDCFRCKGGKALQYFCCQCPRSFHSQCLDYTSQEPGIKWVCPICINNVESQEDPFTGKTINDVLISDLISRPPPMFGDVEGKFQIICKLLEMVLKLKSYDYGSLFSTPVDTKEVPDYFNFVTTPMDLGTVEHNIMNGYYFSPSISEGQPLTEGSGHCLIPRTPLYCKGDERLDSEEQESKEKGINYYSCVSGATPITLTEAEETTLLLSDINGDENNTVNPSPKFGNNVKSFIANIFSGRHFTPTFSKPEENTTATAPAQDPSTDSSTMLLQEGDGGDSANKVVLPDVTGSNAANPLGLPWKHTVLSILKDIELIYHNCFVYNVDDSPIFRMGEVQRRKFHGLLKLHVEQDLDPSLLLEFQEYVRHLQGIRGESPQEKRRIHVISVTTSNGPRPKSVFVVDPHTNQLIVTYSSTIRAFAACTYLKERCGYKEDIRNYQWFAKNVKLGNASRPLFGYLWLDTLPSNDPSENVTESLEFDNEELFEIGINAALEGHEKYSQLEQNNSVVDNSLFGCESENVMLGDMLLINMQSDEAKPAFAIADI